MKNTFGQSIAVTIFGESHGPAVGVVIDGLAPGISVDENFIKNQLSKRRPQTAMDTPRREPDNYKILSGVFSGKTTGSPICIVIPNENTNSSDYNYGPARPSHADYSAFCKYHGFEDYRGGGHFSGRVTAALVAAGGILIPALEGIGITIGTHILSCGEIRDRDFADIKEDIDVLKNSDFPALDLGSANKISEHIINAGKSLDSVGGTTQTAVYGIEAGIGEPWFDSVESIISHAIFSLGGVKGIEFGKGFEFSKLTASKCNDEFAIKDGKVVTKTNNNAGINGGITNGMPILFNCAVKPTPSIAREQSTVDFNSNCETKISIKGRHDPAIIRRICPVIDSVTAIALCDLIAQRYGTDVFTKGIKP